MRYYISVFNINGSHGLVYHKLIKLLKIPTLIITDLDIKRIYDEKENFTQITNLNGRTTTNKTIQKFNSNNDILYKLKIYIVYNSMISNFNRI